MIQIKWEDVQFHKYLQTSDSDRRFKAIFRDRSVKYFAGREFEYSSIMSGKKVYSYMAEVIIDLYTMQYVKHRMGSKLNPVSQEHLEA